MNAGTYVGLTIFAVIMFSAAIFIPLPDHPRPLAAACPVIGATYSGPMVKDCEFMTPCRWLHIDNYQLMTRDKLAQLRSRIRMLEAK